MLHTYMRRVQRFLRDTRSQIINPDEIKTYINEARALMSGETGCIRVMATLSIASQVQSYPFASFSVSSSPGVSGVINVRTVWLISGMGQLWLEPQPFEQFSLYSLNNPAPEQGPPAIWSQFAQGVGGSLYLSPIPAVAADIIVDAVCYPIDLVDDTTVEAIPRMWTYAVPYYAAYLSMLAMETGTDISAADKMFAKYQQYLAMARRSATPDVLPWMYEQTSVPGGLNEASAQTRGAQ